MDRPPGGQAPPPGFLGPPVAPGGGGRFIPPPAVPTTPSDFPSTLPPAGVSSAPPPVIPDSPSQSLRSVGPFPPPDLPPAARPAPATIPAPDLPPPPGTTTPAPSQKPPPEVLLPDNPPRSSSSGFLQDPVRPNSGNADRPPPRADSAPGRPPTVAPEPMPGPGDSRSPVGLPAFAAVPDKPGVASGRRPTLDGFDWLKANGYRAVVYLHDPAADATAARQLAEKRGLRFVAVPVTPAGLRDALAAFNAAVTDAANRPAYVCDDDGLRAGVLWYLHFRTVDLLGDDPARVRAAGLGLRPAQTDAEKQFWLAAQAVLADR